MLKIQQVGLQNAQSSKGNGGFGVRSAAVCWGADLSAGVVFGVPEVVLGVLIYRQA